MEKDNNILLWKFIKEIKKIKIEEFKFDRCLKVKLFWWLWKWNNIKFANYRPMNSKSDVGTKCPTPIPKTFENF